MRWLLDEMLPVASCKQLGARGHDAVTVHDVDLAGAEDARVLECAIREKRVLVTENFADYSLLIEQRMARGEACVPVVFVHKRTFGRSGTLANELARRLDAWAKAHPDPYVGPHWA